MTLASVPGSAYNPNYILNIVLIPTDKCNPHPGLDKLLFETKTIIENYSQSKCRAVDKVQIDTSTKHLPHLRLKEYFQRGRQKIANQRIRKFAVRPCLLAMSEAAPILNLPGARTDHRTYNGTHFKSLLRGGEKKMSGLSETWCRKRAWSGRVQFLNVF